MVVDSKSHRNKICNNQEWRMVKPVRRILGTWTSHAIINLSKRKLRSILIRGEKRRIVVRSIHLTMNDRPPLGTFGASSRYPHTQKYDSKRGGESGVENDRDTHAARYAKIRKIINEVCCFSSTGAKHRRTMLILRDMAGYYYRWSVQDDDVVSMNLRSVGRTQENERRLMWLMTLSEMRRFIKWPNF